MKCNVGTADRVIRGLLGLALFVLGGWVWGGWHGAAGGIVSLIVGVVLAATAAVGFCPLYRLIGVRTCKE
jgi:hypothetical protein